jgi:Chaperone of endosialidase
MPHMVAQEHLGMVDALRYGTARNHTTLAAALAAIGSTPAVLVPTLTGDGVWTICANVTSPTSLVWRIPAGVTVNVASATTLTINGPILADRAGWKTGPGTLTRGTTQQAEISVLTATSLNAAALVATTGTITTLTATTGGITTVNASQVNSGYVNVSVEGEAMRLTNPTIPTRRLQFFTNQGAGSVAMDFFMDPALTNSNWELGINPSLQFYIAHPGGLGFLVINHNGTGLTNSTTSVNPSHVLHMGIDDAFKATATWSTPSDARLKTVSGPYTDGLAMLLALPTPVIYEYNGKAQTPVDGTQYIGLIAQDVQAVAPYMVKTYQDKLDPADATMTDILSLNANPVIFAILNALHEIDTRLRALEPP